MDQPSLFGGPPVPAGPVRVPPVTFYLRMSRRNCEGQAIPCGHCQMNVHRFRAGAAVPDWRSRDDEVILRATVIITHRDGSTLSLCAQHDREYQERGDRNG